MYKIRQIKYSENSVSIQVYKIENRKRVNVRHIETSHNENEQFDLMILANDFIEKASKQLTLFENNKANNTFYLNKTQKLLGIKGYFANLKESKLSNTAIIERYHEPYKIEQAFRIAKSDLQTRPIFHYKEEPIKLHLLICFMSLVVSKHIELKTKISIRKFIHECKKITDARLKNKITNDESHIRATLNQTIMKF